MASAGKYSLQGAFFPLSITVAASYFTKKWSIMTADILTSTCLNTLGLIQIQEPFKVFCHLVVSAALAPKVPPQNFYWEEQNFQHISDGLWKSITQNSKLHTQKKIEQYEWIFQSKSESIVAIHLGKPISQLPTFLAPSFFLQTCKHGASWEGKRCKNKIVLTRLCKWILSTWVLEPRSAMELRINIKLNVNWYFEFLRLYC